MLYQAGGLDVDITHFSVMLGFKIEPEWFAVQNKGHSSRRARRALMIKQPNVLWTLGESHHLGTLSSLSSNSIPAWISERNHGEAGYHELRCERRRSKEEGHLN